MTKFKEVAHLYLGCRVKTQIRQTQGEGKKSIYVNGYLKEVDLHGDGMLGILLDNETDKSNYQYCNFKPVLRPLSDMTEEEFEESAFEIHPKNWFNSAKEYKFKPPVTVWLLKNGFDIFDLIPNGEALDATTLK